MQTSQYNHLVVPAVWPALFSCRTFWALRPNSFEQVAAKIKKEVSSTSSEVTKVLIGPFVNVYFFVCSSRIKEMTRLLIFKLNAFDSKVSFLRHTLTIIIFILRLVFELKFYCLSKSKDIGHPRFVNTDHSLMMHLCFLVNYESIS